MVGDDEEGCGVEMLARRDGEEGRRLHLDGSSPLGGPGLLSLVGVIEEVGGND
jgi:hypothetical protein